jgi:hypothetical protein
MLLSRQRCDGVTALRGRNGRRERGRSAVAGIRLRLPAHRKPSHQKSFGLRRRISCMRSPACSLSSCATSYARRILIRTLQISSRRRPALCKRDSNSRILLLGSIGEQDALAAETWRCGRSYALPPSGAALQAYPSSGFGDDCNLAVAIDRRLPTVSRSERSLGKKGFNRAERGFSGNPGIA